MKDARKSEGNEGRKVLYSVAKVNCHAVWSNRLGKASRAEHLIDKKERG
jgi:hypothetical protein